MNRERLAAVAARLGSSLWFIPTVMTVLSVLVAAASLALDRGIGSSLADTGIFFDAGSEGARGVLSTIAGSIITVTGVVFSVTVVALQLASSQFTPRVLRSFLEDRASQVVLGVFISTFTYSLLVLRAVRASGEERELFVPAVSVTLAVVMALVSIGALIFFVNHTARSMQIETILARVAADVLKRVDVLFPEDLGESPAEADEMGWRTPDAEPFIVSSSSGGYLQNVDEDLMLEIVERNDLLLEMTRPIGDFILEGDALALVWPAEGGERHEERIRGTFHLGAERTLLQDVERGVIELTDIAMRALSPSVNDPTTALACIDRITQVLSPLGRRRFPDPVRMGEDRRARILAIRPSFEEIARIPYGQLRHFGADQAVVALALIESLRRVSSGVPPGRAGPLREELVELLEGARRRIDSATDLAGVERAAAEALGQLDSRARGDDLRDHTSPPTAVSRLANTPDSSVDAVKRG